LAATAKVSKREMADWGPVVIAVLLFVLLSPGLLFQMPGRGRIIEFGKVFVFCFSKILSDLVFVTFQYACTIY
jgi:Protein of unknown function (DUF3339)